MITFNVYYAQSFCLWIFLQKYSMIYYLVNAGLSGYIHIVLGVGDNVGVHEITASLVPLPNACGPAFRHSAHAILSLNCVIVVVQKRM